jgi:hypothetical protein
LGAFGTVVGGGPDEAAERAVVVGVVVVGAAAGGAAVAGAAAPGTTVVGAAVVGARVVDGPALGDGAPVVGGGAGTAWWDVAGKAPQAASIRTSAALPNPPIRRLIRAFSPF